MLSLENLEEFTKQYQTDTDNVVREYCQHLFLSYLYQLPGSERLLFKGGTAMRIVMRSPRFSEDLDFTGVNITQREVDDLFADTLFNIGRTGIPIEIVEAKKTSGGYLGIAIFDAYDRKTNIQVEVSLRNGKALKGTRTVIQSDYLPPYTLVHLETESLIRGKMEALIARHKPRDFYDYFFLLTGNYPLVKDKNNLVKVKKLLTDSKINFRVELRRLLPKSHVMRLRDFKKILADKISTFMG